jgi:drug/metabolite transporter (DMT)-like permease
LLALSAVFFAANFLGKEFHFQPRAGPFIALAVVGFVTAVIGHLTASKTIILTGIGMVSAAVLLVPLALYLSGRG